MFLRVIAPLHFPGATTALVTNLMIQTVDLRGQQRLYTFDIVHSQNPRYVGVQIVPAIVSGQPLPLTDPLKLTPNHIQTGLRMAIRRGYTAIDDPVVAQVQQLLQLVQTEYLTVAEAAQSVRDSLRRACSPSVVSHHSCRTHLISKGISHCKFSKADPLLLNSGFGLMVTLSRL